MGTWKEKHLVTEYNRQNIIFITNNFVVWKYVFGMYESVCAR